MQTWCAFPPKGGAQPPSDSLALLPASPPMCPVCCVPYLCALNVRLYIQIITCLPHIPASPPMCPVCCVPYLCALNVRLYIQIITCLPHIPASPPMCPMCCVLCVACVSASLTASHSPSSLSISPTTPGLSRPCVRLSRVDLRRRTQDVVKKLRLTHADLVARH